MKCMHCGTPCGVAKVPGDSGEEICVNCACDTIAQLRNGLKIIETAVNNVMGPGIVYFTGDKPKKP